MTTTETREQVEATSDELSSMSMRTLWWFMAITFGVGWGIGACLFLFTDQIEAWFGPVSGTNPVFILLVWSPAIAGLALVWRHYGRAGIGSFLRRLTLWKMPSPWWVFLLLGIPAAKYVGAAFNGTASDFPFSPWYGLLPAMAIALFIGPIEELGWRGVALPLLQRRFAPLWSALILGAFWAVWHAPSFLLSGTPQGAWDFGPYLFGVLALSVIITPLFNAAQGSILMAALFHFQVNGPAWPDAQPWENYLFAIVAIAVVILNRKTMLTRTNAATDVLMPGDEADLREPRGAWVPA
ncbi:MAG TPA: type II CAAX endopeptidase family protein [Acidimicrobiia bacterium]|nr:type II CAAX endopeptidase family protein [Acidimicrobiia bacterium]